MIVLAIILAAMILFALLRFGVFAEYSADGFILKARIGFFSILLFPREEKPEKAAKKAAKKAERKARKEKKPKKKIEIKKPGSLQELLDILNAVKNTMSRLRRRLLIKNLTIYFTAGGDDPFVTALSFGAASAAVGAIVPLLENNFRIGRHDFRISHDFISAQPTVYVKAIMSLAAWEAVYIFFALLPAIWAILKGSGAAKRETRKEVHGNG